MADISIADDNDFTIIIADLIETLAGTSKFVLKIWITGSEVPYLFTDEDKFYFMQEGFRVSQKKHIDWFFYDNIVSVRLHYDKIGRLVD